MRGASHLLAPTVASLQNQSRQREASQQLQQQTQLWFVELSQRQEQVVHSLRNLEAPARLKVCPQQQRCTVLLRHT
jgi:hypothetical protein